MAHGRNQVRTAVAVALTGLTTTGANVFQFRVYPHESTAMPSLNIRAGDEEVDEVDGLTRTVQIFVEGRIKATSNLADTLDTISEEVETALAADRTLGGVSIHIIEPGTTTEIEDGAEQPVGMITMVFPIMYRIAMEAPGTILN